MISYKVPYVFQESDCLLVPLLSCARDIQAPLPDPARCLWIRLEWCGGPCCHYRGEFMTSFTQLFSKRKLVWFISKSPVSLLTSGSANETGTLWPLKVFFFLQPHLVKLGRQLYSSHLMSECHPSEKGHAWVVSSRSECNMINSCPLGRNRQKPWTGFSWDKNRKWVEAYKQWQLQPGHFFFIRTGRYFLLKIQAENSTKGFAVGTEGCYQPATNLLKIWLVLKQVSIVLFLSFVLFLMTPLSQHFIQYWIPQMGYLKRHIWSGLLIGLCESYIGFTNLNLALIKVCARSDS